MVANVGLVWMQRPPVSGQRRLPLNATPDLTSSVTCRGAGSQRIKPPGVIDVKFQAHLDFVFDEFCAPPTMTE